MGYAGILTAGSGKLEQEPGCGGVSTGSSEARSGLANGRREHRLRDGFGD